MIGLELLRSPLVSGIVGGVVVAVTNHLFTRRKTAAEIKKLEADTKLTLAQAREITDNLDKQITNNLNNLSDKVGYALSEAVQNNETILYSSDSSDNFDFKVEMKDNASGDWEVKEGIVYIRRSNTVGTMRLWLESYRYAGLAPRKMILKNEDISGDRKLRVSCEIKAAGGEHTLLFVVKGEKDPGGVHLAERRERVTNNEWTPVEAYFRISPSKNCQFRIDDRNVSVAGSSVQIRKFILAERTTTPSGSDNRG